MVSASSKAAPLSDRTRLLLTMSTHIRVKALPQVRRPCAGLLCARSLPPREVDHFYALPDGDYAVKVRLAGYRSLPSRTLDVEAAYRLFVNVKERARASDYGGFEWWRCPLSDRSFLEGILQ